MIVIETTPVEGGAGGAPRPCLFLDRDGVINVDRGWVGRIADFAWVPGIFELMRAAAARGHAIVVVTNQGGIARGYYSEADFRSLTAWMAEQARAAGAPIARVIACPHHPEGAIAELRMTCACRKPGALMLTESAAALGLDLARSAFIGDKPSDMAAGRSAGVGRLILHAPGRGAATRAAEADVTIVGSLAEAQRLLYG